MKIEMITTLYLNKSDLKNPTKIITSLCSHRIDTINLAEGLTESDLKSKKDLWNLIVQHSKNYNPVIITNYRA